MGPLPPIPQAPGVFLTKDGLPGDPFAGGGSPQELRGPMEIHGRAGYYGDDGRHPDAR